MIRLLIVFAVLLAPALALGQEVAAPAPSWLAANWPWLLSTFGPVLIASIINAVSQHPTKDTPKIVAALKFVNDLLAAIPYKNSPGRVQLPLVQVSKPPQGVVDLSS